MWSSRRRSGVAAGLGALTAVLLGGACAAESSVVSRSFALTDSVSVPGRVRARLTRVTYGPSALVVTVVLTNLGDAALHHEARGATVEFEGLHYPATEADPTVVAPQASGTVVLKYALGRRLFAPAQLVLRDLRLGTRALPPLRLEVPQAPRPEGDHSGTGP